MADSSAADNSYFDNHQFSDLTIRLNNDRTVHVHRVILCRGSEYFRKLLAGSFSESGAKEIKLLDDDPGAMVEVLRAIYGIAYLSFGAPHEDPWVFHSTVYVTAEKYQLEATKLQAFEALACLVLPEPDSDTNDHWSIVNPRPIENYTNFSTAIRTVFNGTLKIGDPVRLLMARYCLWSASVLMAMKDFKDLLRELPDLAILLLERQMDISKDPSVYQYIGLEVFGSTEQLVAHGQTAALATPNDHVRAARKLTTSRIEMDSVQVFPPSLAWNFDASDNWPGIEKHEFDTSFAEIMGNRGAPRLAKDSVGVVKIKFKACDLTSLTMTGIDEYERWL